jgi:hypothetical protein
MSESPSVNLSLVRATPHVSESTDPLDPAGKFLAKVLPTKTFRIFGRECSLNPGPFSPKEHMLITMYDTNDMCFTDVPVCATSV